MHNHLLYHYIFAFWRSYNPTLQRAVEMCNRSVNSMKAAEVETQSLYLAHPLVLSNQLATHLNIFDEITQFYRGGRVTQAISLNAINAADVAFGNPLLFAKSDVYSITHDTLPFNVCLSSPLSSPISPPTSHVFY